MIPLRAVLCFAVLLAVVSSQSLLLNISTGYDFRVQKAGFLLFWSVDLAQHKINFALAYPTTLDCWVAVGVNSDQFGNMPGTLATIGRL